MEDKFTKSLVMITGVGACMIQNFVCFCEEDGFLPRVDSCVNVRCRWDPYPFILLPNNLFILKKI